MPFLSHKKQIKNHQVKTPQKKSKFILKNTVIKS